MPTLFERLDPMGLWRCWTQHLDRFYYNVEAVDHLLTDDILALGEGGIVEVVSGHDGFVLKPYSDAEAYLSQPAVGPVVIAVAGVGSSSVGAAAFGRDIAAAVQGPVAVVVAGYGALDFWSEALGGYFWFGRLNALRYYGHLLNLAPDTIPALTWPFGLGFVRASSDTQSVLKLLRNENFTPAYLIGHSKGNLVLSEALYALEQSEPDRALTLGETTRVITISARVGMPQYCQTVYDVIGDHDVVGEMNSRVDLVPDHVVPWGGHSTRIANTGGYWWEGPINVTNVLRHHALKEPPGPESRWNVISTLVFDVPQRMVGRCYRS